MKTKGKHMKRGILIAFCVVLALAAFALAGCGNSAKDGDTLVYGSGDYTAINPALYEHGEINLLLFAGLTAHDENNKVVPGLAKDWKWDEGSKTYTFNLRDGLTFHDGEPLTSKDVKFTLESILDEKNASEIVSNYKDIKKITCPNDTTVKIQLKETNVAFPDYMTIGILPEHLLKGKDLATDEFNQNPVGAGPYKLTDWDEGQSITMEKFDDYYAGAPNIGTVIFKIVPDFDARALQLESGDLDMAQIAPKSAKKFKDNGDFNVYNMKTADYRAICYNYNNKLWQDHPELPNILSYGIDRDAIVKSVLLGEGEAAYSPIQKNKYNDKNIEHFSYDPDKCRNLLEENGWEKNKDGWYAKDGKELAFTINAMEDDTVRVDMAKLCAEQLKKIGVNVTAEAKAEMDWENQETCIIGWGSPFDADDHTYKIFTTGAGDNYTYYSNKGVDKALTKARTIDDTNAEGEAARAEQYKNFLNAMTEKMPYTFIAYVDADYVVNKDVTGITEDTLLGHHGVGIFWNVADWKLAGAEDAEK